MKRLILAALATGLARASEPVRLEAITVTADALVDQREAVAQKTVIERKEIEALGGLTVGEVVRKLPGIEAGEHGADGGMSARARGMNRDAVQFLVNGERPTANARFALTQIGRMPAGELERIEILRGGSAEFGGAAPLTVNLVMRRPVGRDATSLNLAAGRRGPEANGQATVSRGGQGADGRFSWILPVTVNHHGMPVDRSLMRADSPGAGQREAERGAYAIDEFILSPRLSWRRGADLLTLWPSYYRNEGENATDMIRGAGGADGGRIDREDNGIHIARLRAEGEMRVGEDKLSARAAVMAGRRFADRERTARDALGALTAWSEAERRQDREFSGAVRLDRAAGTHFLSGGIDFARHRRADRQADAGAVAGGMDFDGEERQWSLWVQDEWLFRPGLTATLGLRGERMRIAADGGQRSHGAVDPALALRWEPVSGWIARASLTRAIRFPKLDELTALAARTASANAPLEPDRGGNPGLRPERIANLEVGLERHWAGGVLGANLYLRHTRDFVERRAQREGTRWVERPYNEGDARHEGVELSAKLSDRWPRLPKGSSLRAQLTLSRGEVDDARLHLTRRTRESPRHAFSLSYEGGLPDGQTSWGLQWRRHGAVKTDVPGELAADTRQRDLFDLHIVRRLDAALNLRLAWQNILGAEIRRTAAARHGVDAWRLETREAGPRTWLLSLEGKW